MECLTEYIEPSRERERVDLELIANDNAIHEHVVDLREQYTLGELIGEGGMGHVYKAVHKRSQKTFAIKILKAELAEEAASLKRFQSEVDLVSHLDHRNLANVYDTGTTDDGKPYIVMDLIDGSSLK